MREVRHINVPVTFARRMPDPLLGDGANRHFFLVRIRDIPQGFPLDPNPREANTDKRIYREIAASLKDDEVTVTGTFHLKHKGMTLIAEKVDKLNDNLYRLTFRDGQGLVDGNHTYELIHKTAAEDPALIPDQQWVKLEVLTGIPPELVTDISGGLNTALQVRPESLFNSKGLFDNLKRAIADRPYADKIAWYENDEGPVSVLEVIALLTTCNIGLYPNRDDSATAITHPVVAYSGKTTALNQFVADQGRSEGERTFDRMIDVIPGVLELYDRIRKEAQVLWQAAPENRNSRFGQWSIVEHRQRGEFTFWFLPEGSNTHGYRLVNAAALPILAAFRCMIEVDPDTGNYRWRGGFDAAKSLWQKIAVELLRTTFDVSRELGRNPNALGKSRPHWSNMYNIVAFHSKPVAQPAAD